MFWATYSRHWTFALVGLLTFLLSVSHSANMFSICDEGTRYEIDFDECPGGIQIRNLDNWFSNSREQTCICGDGSVLQFNGAGDKRRINKMYGLGADINLIPFVGSFDDYNLQPTCELLKGNTSSALFLNLKKYQNPLNFPSRAIDVNVENFEADRLAGNFRLVLLSGVNDRHQVLLYSLTRTILVNNQEPVLIKDDEDSKFYNFLCSYNATNPEVIMTRYFYSTWGNQDIEKSCNKGLYKPYIRPSYICPKSCHNAKKFEPSPSQPNMDQPSVAFHQIMQTMGEIAIRMKYAEKFVTFTHKDHPYAAILQNSCRVFHRAFPDVVKWETLMSAVTLFGVAFEGLVPSAMEITIFEHMKIMLGRCTLKEMRRQKENSQMLKEMCPAIKGAVEMEMNSSIANVNLNPSSATTPSSSGGKEGKKPGGGEGGSKMKTSFGGAHNIVIELLWKVVQYVHGSCLPSTDHFPNVHHAYTNAMIEMFSAPAVQLLWFQQGKYDYRQLGKAMIHIFPELQDHVLPTMELILQKLKFETYYTLLQRPKLGNLDERDMRCAGHGKMIWGGKACCYRRSEDKKFYYFNKVAYAKL